MTDAQLLLAGRVLRLPAKRIRAEVVRDYMVGLGHDRVVCFTSGNAGACLREQGLDVLSVGPGGALLPGRWWQPSEIAAVWPDRFDATSGHLPMHLMALFAVALQAHLGPLGPGPWLVPTGSGETLCALALVYPGHTLCALTHTDHHTDHHDAMPLAPLVAAHRVIKWTAPDA